MNYDKNKILIFSFDDGVTQDERMIEILDRYGIKGEEAKSVDEIRTDDRALWYATNPALGIRLSEDFAEEELRSESADGFARERLGWWSPVLTEAVDRPIEKAAWEACRSKEEKTAGKTAFGVKFTADGTEAVLCGAVIQPDGRARISMIERRQTVRGTRWLSDWLNARYEKACCVVIDGRNGVDLLVERLAETWKAKNSVVRAGTKDVIAAASLLTNEVHEQTLTWYGPQDIALSDSVLSATKRPIGGGWGFGGDDPAPAEACALALWGVRTSKRDPSRKMRIG